VTFAAMAAEAINLYMTLVIVLGAKIPYYVLKAVIVCWVVPFIIVIFCFAPNYENYIRSHL
jgi:energy-coupling factor transporter transmembrane protein EcfT